MKLRLYAVLDKAVQAFNPPLCFRSEGEALRSFAAAVSDDRSMIGKYKTDYAFCFLGFYDDNTGQVESLPAVVSAEASTVLAQLNGYDSPDPFPGG
ncbi:MAG: nonstructural protein [Microviridae sp.]|nr:MAG: nonstructural protein [Microviridae sp.]